MARTVCACRPRSQSSRCAAPTSQALASACHETTITRSRHGNGMPQSIRRCDNGAGLSSTHSNGSSEQATGVLRLHWPLPTAATRSVPKTGRYPLRPKPMRQLVTADGVTVSPRLGRPATHHSPLPGAWRHSFCRSSPALAARNSARSRGKALRTQGKGARSPRVLSRCGQSVPVWRDRSKLIGRVQRHATRGRRAIGKHQRRGSH